MNTQLELININEKLKRIIVDVANGNIDEDQISEKAILTADFDFDSLKLIELVVEIEYQFDIIIDDNDLDIEKLAVYSELLNIVFKMISTQR